MKKIIIILISGSALQISAMQTSDPKDALLKFALLEFVKTSNLPAFSHFMKNGQKHLVDQEIQAQARAQYENNKKNNPSNLFNHPASQILYKIENQIIQFGGDPKVG